MSGESVTLGTEGLDDEFNLVDQIELDAAKEEIERKATATQMLRAKKEAYARVFVDGNSTADDRKTVMADLAWFCREKRSTFHPNVQMAARLDGRREVALRINEFLELSVDALVQLKL